MITKILFIITIGLSIPLYLHFSKIPVQKIPYPYKIPNYKIKQTNAPIVVLGDRMAKRLYQHKSSFVEAISPDYSRKIEIDELAEDNDALFRSLYKLKAQKSFPKVVIYQGASVEEWEYRFITSEHEKILKNFQHYEDSKIQTLLVLFPFLSKIIYQPVRQVEVTPDVIIDPNSYTGKDLFKRMEIHYKLFEHELEELVELTRINQSILILTTTPVNPNISPKTICEGTSDREIDNRLKDLTKLIKQKNFKESFQHAQILHYMAIGNAQAQFIYSRLARKAGLKKDAYHAFEQASSYDCKRWRGNGVYNSIIRKIASKHDIFLYDYDQYLFDNVDKNQTFFDELYPQTIYYENVATSLGRLIKKVLNL